jgi:hypothetical protein
MPDFGNTAVFSQVDANNNTGTMPSWLGTAAPSTLDDAGRALQGAVTREWNWRNYTVTAGGTADAKTLTYSVAPAAYYNGQTFSFIANTTNTGAVTLNINTLGAKAVRKVLAGTPTVLAAGDMVSGARVEVAYNLAADAFDWVNSNDLKANLAGGNTFVGSQVITGGLTVGDNQDIVPTTTTAGLSIFGRSTGYPNGGGIVFRGNTGGAGGTTSDGLEFYAGGVEVARVDGGNKNLVMTGAGALGYGTGSGGTVTQATSKGTGVTLNKTNGEIVMNNAALGAGVTVNFTLTCSAIAANDVVLVNIRQGAYTASNYRVQANPTTGNAIISLTNQSGGSLSDALILNFAVIKAVNA